MTNTRFNLRRVALAASALAFSLQPAFAQTTTILADDFDGMGLLNGSMPDVGAVAWDAGPGWELVGGIASQAEFNVDHAFLPFTPQQGTYYILSVAINPVAGVQYSWTAMGYSQYKQNLDGVNGNWWDNFHENNRNVGPWALKRYNGGLVSLIGPRAGGGQRHGAAVAGEATTYDVCLDTRNAQWSALWRIDQQYVRTANIAQTPRDYVGFGVGSGHGDTSVDNFRLVEVHAPNADEDLVSFCADNCPRTSNTDQADTNGDGIGDACEGDSDNDQIIDFYDNCVDVPNTDQADWDDDGVGNACDVDFDTDGDGVFNGIDNCVDVPNADQADLDTDGLGDACDDDDDGDGASDLMDNCPITYNADQSDLDQDGMGDACDDTFDAVNLVDDAEVLTDTLVDEIGDLGFPGGPGLINKLQTGNGSVLSILTNAIADYDAGIIDSIEYIAELQDALDRLDQFDFDLANKIPNQMTALEAAPIQAISADLRALIQLLIDNA